MKKTLLVTLLCICTLLKVADAQLAYNSAFALGLNISDQGYSITADAAGNYYTTGFHGYWMDANPMGTPYYIYNNGGQDFYVIKYNSSGIMQWAFNIGGVGDDAALKIKLDASNNVYVAGRFTDTVDFNPGTGTASFISHGGFDIFLAKYDNNGIFQWVNTFGDSLNDQAWDVAINNVTGNALITGVYGSYSMDMDPGSGTHLIYNNAYNGFGGGNCFVAAYSLSSGAYQWAFNIGGVGGCTGSRITADNSGNILVGGTVSGDSTDFDSGVGTFYLNAYTGGYDVFLAKYSGSGAFQWAGGFGSTWGQTGSALACDNDGNIYQGGYFNFDSIDVDPGPGTYYLHNYPNGVQDIYVAKFNPSGQLIWAFSVGGYYSEVAQDLALDNNGHFFITGNFGDTVDFDPGPAVHNLFMPLTSSGAYLAEYDTAGHYIDAIGFIGNGSQFGIGVCVIPPNKVGVTGFFSSDTIDFDPGPAVHNLFVNGGNSTWSDAFVATYTYNAVGIDEHSGNGNLFSIYPNPARSKFIVRSSDPFEKNARLKIYNVMGMDVQSELINQKSEMSVDIRALPPGIYFIKVTSEKGSAVQKLVVE